MKNEASPLLPLTSAALITLVRSTCQNPHHSTYPPYKPVQWNPVPAPPWPEHAVGRQREWRTCFPWILAEAHFGLGPRLAQRICKCRRQPGNQGRLCKWAGRVGRLTWAQKELRLANRSTCCVCLGMLITPPQPKGTPTHQATACSHPLPLLQLHNKWDQDLVTLCWSALINAHYICMPLMVCITKSQEYILENALKD